MHKKENLRANYKEGRVKWSQINVDSDQILKLGLEPRSRYPRPNFLHILPVCQTGKEIHKSKLMMMKYMYTGLFLPAFNNFMTFKFWVSEGTEGLNPTKKHSFICPNWGHSSCLSRPPQRVVVYFFQAVPFRHRKR